MGRKGWDRFLVVRLQQDFPGLSPAVAAHLAATYGGTAADVLRVRTAPQGGRRDSGGKRGGGHDGGSSGVGNGGGARGEEAAAAEVAWQRVGTPLVAGFPYLEEEVVWAARRELCASAAAVLGQRTRLAYLNSRAAAAALPRVVELLRGELGWSEDEAAAQSRDAHAFLSTFGGPEPRPESSATDAAVSDAAATDAAAEALAIGEAFRALDKDGSGTLTVDELVLALRALGVTDDASTATIAGSGGGDLVLATRLAAELAGGSGGSGGGDAAAAVTLTQFTAWWAASGVDPGGARLRAALHRRYAATPRKLGRQTGTAFG